MDDISRRQSALHLAMQYTGMLGIRCPGCLIDTATKFDDFLRTGKADVPHLDPVDAGDDVPEAEEAPKPEGTVVDFQPKKPTKH